MVSHSLYNFASVAQPVRSTLLYQKQCEIVYPTRMTPGPARSDPGIQLSARLIGELEGGGARSKQFRTYTSPCWKVPE
ncbi:UNVERIFIED_CONTAM: hypothetical protein FKN15_049730 [Acipenser sinensis]